MERPSVILVCAFAVAQLVATFIAVYADWGFTNIHGCGWSWAGIAWIWNIIWFFPLDFVKFALQAYFDPKHKEVVDEALSARPSTDAQIIRRKSTMAGGGARRSSVGRRSTMVSEGARSRADTITQAASKYYAPQTSHLETSHHHRNFARMLKITGNDAPRVAVDHDELRRFSLVQAHHAAKLLNVPSGNANRRITTAV